MAPSTSTPCSQSSGSKKKRLASHNMTVDSSKFQRDNQSPEAYLHNPQHVGQANTPMQSLSRSEELPRDKAANLSKLPSELLEIIASKLCSSKDLLNLALVNKYFHSICMDAMTRQLVVSRKHIKKYLEMLGKRPDLINKVNDVNLGDYGCVHHTACSCMGSIRFDLSLWNFFYKKIVSNTSNAVNATHILRPKRTPESIWRPNQALFLDLLICLCPNIKSMTLELPEARPFDVPRPTLFSSLGSAHLPTINQNFKPVSPFQGAALQILQKKLQVLVIAEDSRWKGPRKLEVLTTPRDISRMHVGKHTITLPGFTKLRSLDIPMDILGHPQNVVFVDIADNTPAMGRSGANENNDITAAGQNSQHEKVLPLCIMYLRLRSCNELVFPLLQKINEIPVDKVKLKHIELFFKHSPRDSTTMCYAADGGQLDYPRILSDLTEKSVKISTYAGKNEKRFDMKKELAALSVLSPFEAWQSSIWSKQYSELDTEASSQRRSSVSGGRIFVRHANEHFRLMNSPTFRSKAWTDVAFFHGPKNTKWDSRITPRKPKLITIDPGNWNTRLRGKQNTKRRLPYLRDLNHATFDFRVTRSPVVQATELPFLGAKFNIQDDASRTVQNITQGTKRKSSWRSNEGHVESCSDESLEQRLAKLELYVETARTPDDDELGIDRSSRFRPFAWADINWKPFLLPPNTKG